VTSEDPPKPDRRPAPPASGPTASGPTASGPITAAPGTAIPDDEAWDTPVTAAAGESDPEEALYVELDGFSGPLDLLLALARTHKIDLAQISILALVDQYLAFIAEARRVNLEIAADYLVMAAWLAFLKSRLLIPKDKPDDTGPSGDELKALLHFRLQRLDAMRRVAAQLMTRKRLGQDIFYRGEPETVRTVRETVWTADIYDLLKAYADQRRRSIKPVHVVKRRIVWSIKDARRQLERLVGHASAEWVQLDLFLHQYLPPDPAPGVGRSVLASSFGATLEMAREGMIELRQDAMFGPIHMRRAGAAPPAGQSG
jgi:segregation and condensation protein A